MVEAKAGKKDPETSLINVKCNSYLQEKIYFVATNEV